MTSPQKTTIKNEKVGVIGSGLIGRSWAMLFAATGYSVALYDVDAEQVSAALRSIQQQLAQLQKQGLLRGTLSTRHQEELISAASSLEDCVRGAVYVQECVPEQEDLKKAVFGEIDVVCSNTTVLASSTSSIPASRFTAHLKHRDQVIVAHPTNPPFYCPLVEVCPTPFTRSDVTEATMAILAEIGEVPVLIKKEVKGFVLNRLQFALMNECWRLVKDDVISITDLDAVMRDGLGTRYAFTGPLESCHLNAEGMENYCERYGESIYNITAGFGPVEKWGGETGARINQVMEKLIPVEHIEARRARRDKRLAALTSLKNKMVVTKPK